MTSTSSFAVDLWDGFHVIRKKSKEGTDYCEEISKYLQKFAGLTNSFGKGLQSLAKTKITTNETDTTLVSCWHAMVEATENMAKIYIEFSDQLTKTPETMQTYVKESRKKCKQLSTTGKKMLQDLSKSESNVAKTKVNFYKLRRKQDESMEEYTKAKSTQTASVVTKLGKKADQDTKTAEKADKEYAESVKKHKYVQEKLYKEEMPKILQEFQNFEEERIKSLKAHFETVLALQEPIPDNLSQLNELLDKSIKSIDVAQDIESFITKNKGEKRGPDYACYEPYDASSISNRYSIAPSSPVFSQSPSLVKESRDSIAPASPPVDLKSHRESTPDQIGESLRALYDYNATDENELTFKANDIICVLQKDESGWWQGRLPNGEIGMFPSNFVAPLEGSNGVENGKKDAKQCTCLYDYVATDEDELSMKEGDTMTIESEDNGWYFVHNQLGKFGRIPSNYVKLLE